VSSRRACIPYAPNIAAAALTLRSSPSVALLVQAVAESGGAMEIVEHTVHDRAVELTGKKEAVG
jgi:hypothetical protein